MIMLRFNGFRGTVSSFSRMIATRGYQVPTTAKKIIPVYPPAEVTKDRKTILQTLSVKDVNEKLDTSEWRRKLLGKTTSCTSTTTVQSGDIVRVLYDKSKCDNDAFIGYVLSVDKKELVQDASLLLRNQISKTFVELRVPIFSPLVERIDILKKGNSNLNSKKRQRNKHYYIRGTRLDVSDLESMLRKRK